MIKEKEQFASFLLDDLLERKCTKQELSILYNITERHVREEIAEISLKYPVISHSKAKGYRICNVKKLLEENDRNHINSEMEEIRYVIAELNSRIKMLKKRQRALIGALKVLEKGGK